VLRGPDHVITIVDLTRPEQAGAAAGPLLAAAPRDLR
jgi:hypothetical protein